MKTKTLLLIAILILGCSKETIEEEAVYCPCRTVNPPQLTQSYSYSFCPKPPVEGFYEEFENTYHAARWWEQWERENPCP